MSNFQTARIALGARLREIRSEAGLTGKGIADLLGWPQSKVSKLETGKQTPSRADVEAWADAVGRPGAKSELTNRLRALETHYASWKRQMAAGVRARQEAWQVDEQNSSEVINFEAACVPGLLQTAEYARHMFLRLEAVYNNPGSVDDGVRARMHRQQILYEPGRQFHILLWEGALHVMLCPPEVMTDQLDRLASSLGMHGVRVGIIPLGAPIGIAPSHGFWIYDQKTVKVETIGAELRIVEAPEVQLYLKAWRQLQGAAVYGPDAHRLLARARMVLDENARPND